MPASPRRRALTLAGTLASVQTAVILLASRAVAAPSPTPTPSGGKQDDCDLLLGQVRENCEKGGGSGGSSGPPDPSNP
ncbi:hypothetical protein JBE04_43975, partial [Streptomyces sp. PRKS01-29]|nr:hypothetical protein [Streptomyces sabulosicollis]